MAVHDREIGQGGVRWEDGVGGDFAVLNSGKPKGEGGEGQGLAGRFFWVSGGDRLWGV